MFRSHPSGDPVPSIQDVRFTRRIAKAGETMGIRLVDHVIVGHHFQRTPPFRKCPSDDRPHKALQHHLAPSVAERMHGKDAEGARKPKQEPSGRVRFGRFVFDHECHSLLRDGQEVGLPLRSLLVLGILLRSPGKTVPRESLIDEVWRGGFVTDTSLTEAISRLRQALGDEARQPLYIQTVHGRGYKLIARVAGLADAPPVIAVSKHNGMHGWIAAAMLVAVVAWIAATIFEPETKVPPDEAAFSAESIGPAEGPPENARLMYRLAEVTMKGEPRARYGFPPLPLDDLSVDPIGGRIAFSMESGQGSDIWMLLPSSGVLQRIASGGHFSDPVWTVDGRGLALAHNRRGSIDLMYGEPGSGQEMEVLLEAPFDQFPESWSRDGRSLVYSERHPQTGFDLWILRQLDNGLWQPTPLVRTERQEAFGALSPDGRYVAYVSKGDEDPEVFAIDLRQPQTAARVSLAGGRFPFWSASGDRLHYVEGDVVWTLDIEHLEGAVQPSERRRTPVAGVHLAAPSADDGFVVAVLDGAGRDGRE